MSAPVTKGELEAILQAQKSAFEGFVKTFMDSLSGRLDSMLVQLTKIECSVTSLEKRVDSLERGSERQHALLSSVEERADGLADQSDYLENQSRRNNLLFQGIPESPSETWEVTEAKVKSELISSLGFSPTEVSSIVIERAHRVGRPRAPHAAETNGEANRRHPRTGAPRPIVAKLLSFKDREAILRRAKERRPKELYVNEDVSARVRERRRQQADELKRHREEGRIAYFSLDKLVVRERKG